MSPQQIQDLSSIAALLQDIQQQLSILNQKVEAQDIRQELSELRQQVEAIAPAPAKEFVSKRELREVLDVGMSTITEWKKSWTKNVHYFPSGENGKGDTYNLPLITDWKINRNNPAQHQKAIELWLKQRQRKR